MVVRTRLRGASSGLAPVTGAARTTPPPAPRSTRSATRATPPSGTLAGTKRSVISASPGSTLAFAGDGHFTGRTRQLLTDPATAFGPIRGVRRTADFTSAKLATTSTTGGT